MYLTMSKILNDPIAVHLNMLHGTIAKPSLKNIVHLYPELASLVEALEEFVGCYENDSAVSGAYFKATAALTDFYVKSA